MTLTPETPAGMGQEMAMSRMKYRKNTKVTRAIWDLPLRGPDRTFER